MGEAFEPIDVAVVGGGISGLACAFWAKRTGRSVALFEASENVGGSIRTHRMGRYIADGGPQSFLPSGAFTQLIDDAGLGPLFLPASPSAVKPYLYHRGRLVPVPQSPQQVVTSPLLSPFAKLRLLGEPAVASKRGEGDESVAEFVRRRAGAEVLERLVSPFVSGIFGGDAAKLSMRSAFPMMADFERQHGSVVRGAMARMKAAGQNGAGRRRKNFGFRGGNDVLPRALAAHLVTEFNVNAQVKAMWQRGKWMELLVAGQPDSRVIAKTIVVATPAPAAADLLEPLEPKAAMKLRELEHPTVVQIAMAYPRAAIGVPLDGFGFLASRREGLKILGCVWNSAMFPDRCPQDEMLLTAFLGGAMDTSVVSQSDEELAKAAHRDLQRVLKIGDYTPHVVAGFRWQEAIPQYNLGHAERLRIVSECLARLPHVRLCGNYLKGPSVPDCIDLAKEVATSVATDL